MKNKGKGRKFLFFAISRGALIAILILILLLVPTVRLISENKKLFERKFFGAKAEYQGVLTLWNIDTFEGGNVGKSYFLESCAAKFEKQNKGAFIKVENMSVDQMQESLKQGILPDMVSFGTGLGKYFVQHLVTYLDSDSKGVLSNFYGAGIYGGKFLAMPYMSGIYTLISTAEKLQSAGKEYAGNLKEIALDLAWTKKQRKSEKQIYSLTFGQNDYVGAMDCFSREFAGKSIEELIAKNIVDIKCKSQSPYQAYASFIASESSVLLGTQRDVIRMQNRQMAGKENDVIYCALGDYCDLVQFVGICTIDKAKYSVLSAFVQFLLSDEIQNSLKDIGMFSVNGKSIYKDGVFAELEKVLDEKTVVRSAF